MANLSIQTSTTEILAALRSTALGKLENPQQLTTLYKLWANAGERVAVQAFRTETAPYGSPWQELSPITKKLDAGGKRRGKLRKSGALFDSLAGQVLSDGAQIGTNQVVGAYSLGAIHQFGAIVPITPKSRAFFRFRFSATKNEGWSDLANLGNDFVEIPARPFLPMDEQGEPLPQFIAEIEEITIDWLFG